jgi:hypothetical protein
MIQSTRYDRPMPQSSPFSFFRQFSQHWVSLASVVVGEALWFAWLDPLWPRSPLAWAATVVAGMLVVLWVWGSVMALQWIKRTILRAWLCQTVALLITVIMGAGVLAAVYQARVMLM